MQESPRTHARAEQDVDKSRLAHNDEDLGEWEMLIAHDTAHQSELRDPRQQAGSLRAQDRTGRGVVSLQSESN